MVVEYMDRAQRPTKQFLIQNPHTAQSDPAKSTDLHPRLVGGWDLGGSHSESEEGGSEATQTLSTSGLVFYYDPWSGDDDSEDDDL